MLTCIVLFAPIAQKELAENALRDIGFSKPVTNSSLTPLAESKKLVERSHKLEDDTENAKKEINTTAIIFFFNVSFTRVKFFAP